MLRPTGRLAAAAVLVAALGSATLAAPATAKPTETATLQCGPTAYTVDGFGRGQVLHVTDSTHNFVITRAVRADGTVVFDSPSRADRPLVTCTTTTPGPDRTRFTFTGFFTPAR